MDAVAVSPPDVRRSLGEEFQQLLDDLVSELASHQSSNRERTHYYTSRNILRDLGIAIPPSMRNVEVALGWPAKAVDQMAGRVRMEGFVLPGGDVVETGVPALWRMNRMDSLAPQAHVAALIHGVAFAMVSRGPRGPVITVHDALRATGLWDDAGKELRAALVITGVDGADAVRMVVATPTVWAELERGSTWTHRVIPHGLGRVPVEPLVHRPNITRPFGSSRITRPAMRITDSALRTILRSEVGAEFYSAPQRYLLGADESMFQDESGNAVSQWSLVMGRVLAVPADDEDSKPEVGQFPQISMQPHGDQMRMWAQLFAAETSLPVSALGVVQDNPASAEAIYAAKEDLIIEAEMCADSFGATWCRVAALAAQMSAGAAEPLPGLDGLDVRWRDPSTPSRAAATDAVMKQVAAGVVPADSDVALEQVGYDEATIARIAEHRRASGPSGVARLADALTRAQRPAGGADAVGA